MWTDYSFYHLLVAGSCVKLKGQILHILTQVVFIHGRISFQATGATNLNEGYFVFNVKGFPWLKCIWKQDRLRNTFTLLLSWER